jgi:hypothetical protein
MRRFAWLILAVWLMVGNASAIQAQDSYHGDRSRYNGGYDNFDQVSEFIKSCQLELFSKFEQRRFGITPINGQPYSFELWADSLNRHYLIFVEIARQGWDVSHDLSIPYIFNRYSRDFHLDACVKILQGKAAEPLMAKIYRVEINGRKNYQVIRDNPDSGGLYVPFRERLSKENQAYRILTVRLSADIYSLIN